MDDKWTRLAKEWRLTTPGLRNLWELSGNPEWDSLLQLLKDRREAAVRSLVAAQLDQLAQRQGELRGLDRLIRDLEKIIEQADAIGGNHGRP
jgi:hypothetical protein